MRNPLKDIPLDLWVKLLFCYPTDEKLKVYIEEEKQKLNAMIENNNYNLIDSKIIEKSKYIDKLHTIYDYDNSPQSYKDLRDNLEFFMKIA